MREDLAYLCKDTKFSRITSCLDYGTKDCPKVCYYAKEQEKKYSLPASQGVINCKTHHFLLLVVFLTIIVTMLPAVYAETYKVNEEANLQFICTLNGAIPSASATYNITISYPNSSIWINNKRATALGQGAFNYSITPVLTGTYKILEFCYDGTYSYSNTEYIDVTGNGKPEASGSIIVLFSILFIILTGSICWLAVSSLGHLLKLDFDILDFAKNFGIYVVLIVMYYLEAFYVGNTTMDSFLLMLVKWGWIFFILVPMIALLLSLTVGSLQKKQMNVRLPQQARRRL